MSDISNINTPKASTLVSRNLKILGRRTSVRLEPVMWKALAEIAGRETSTIHELATAIHKTKEPGTTLTAALRVFAVLYFRAAATEDGHSRAGHGDFRAMLARARLSSMRPAARCEEAGRP